jgi:acyl-CoA synthetase (AMP-forming)/AMP-acid ligase II
VASLAETEPDRPAAGFPLKGEPRYSYGSLWEVAAAFAEALGPLPEAAHVMLIMPMAKPLLAAHLGVMQQGGAASIFTHPSEKMREDVYARNLQHAIAVLHPHTVITTRGFLAAVESIQKQNHFNIVLADEVPERSRYEPQAWRSVDPDTLAVIQYSSGSTGLQKCVGLTHRMVVGQCESYARFINLNKDQDHICSWLPLYHDMGLFTAWLMPLTQGVAVSMIDPFAWVKQPLSLFELITRVKGTLCWQPNFAFHLLASRFGRSVPEEIDLRSMRGFSNCSEPVSAATFAAFRDAFSHLGVTKSAMWVCYAMAENAFAVTATANEKKGYGTLRATVEAYTRGEIVVAKNQNAMEIVSCGRPIEGCRLRVVDEDRRGVPEGRVGEIAVNSPFRLKGYVGAPELSAAQIDREGWYYTGDLGALVGGELFVTGRKKDLLIVAGRNFYPQDIEAISNECQGVIPGRTVALGKDDPTTGTQKVIVILESTLTDDGKKAQLASEVRQKVFDVLDCPVADVRIVPHMWLLKTSSGKIARAPNLEKYNTELAAKPVPRSLSVVSRQEPASLASVCAWAALIAVMTYLYVLIFVLGDNPSWNVYAGF